MSDTNTTNLLTLDQAGARLAMSTETVRRYVRSGRLNAFLLGGRYRIEPAELELYIRRGRKALNGVKASA